MSFSKASRLVVGALLAGLLISGCAADNPYKIRTTNEPSVRNAPYHNDNPSGFEGWKS